MYTVGFALDNPNLKGMVKGDGKYIYAKNAEALDSAFTELSTRIAAMIVDPMGDEVTYVRRQRQGWPQGERGLRDRQGHALRQDTDGRTLRCTSPSWTSSATAPSSIPIT